MRRWMTSAFAVGAVAITALEAGAAGLQVAPVLLDVPAPGATTTITLRNESAAPLDAQVRIFRWTQVNGQERLTPASGVVASPPMAKLGSRSDYTVRVVRTDKAPVSKEESYRLVVDELPNPAREKNGTVVVVLRHSVPVFFEPADAGPARLRWSTRIEGGQLIVSATNEGGRRVRLSAMKVSDGSATVDFGSGLVGYALAGSTMSWKRALPKNFNGGSVKVTAMSDAGPINATASAGR